MLYLRYLKYAAFKEIYDFPDHLALFFLIKLFSFLCHFKEQ